MPGMMDTVLNLGLNEADAPGPRRAHRQRAVRLGRLPALHPDVRTHRPGRQPRSASTTRSMPKKARARREAGHGPRRPRTCASSSASSRRSCARTPARTSRTDPYQQLDLAVKAVFASWFGKRANDYRNSQKIAHDLGTAVNVVTMVFGNMGDDSGTGVAFTRDPNTGEKVLFGEYLTNAQGEDVVAGIRTAPRIAQMADGDARGLRGVPAHRPAARAALPRRPGPRVHHRARPAVHAPDALRASGPPRPP